MSVVENAANVEFLEIYISELFPGISNTPTCEFKKQSLPSSQGELFTAYNTTAPAKNHKTTKYQVETITSQTFNRENLDDEYEVSVLDSLDTYLISRNENPIELCRLVEVSKTSRDLFCALAMVKEIFPIKEIWVKSRKEWITTAMVMICDSTGFAMKLTMYGGNCKPLFSFRSGQVIYISDFSKCAFHGETILRLNSKSKIFNLGQADNLSKLLAKGSPSSLVSILKGECIRFIQMYPMHFRSCESRKTSTKPRVPFCDMGKLYPGTLIHTRVIIRSLNVSNHKLIISSLDDLKTCRLFLHGSAQSWMKKITLLRTHIWEFHFLACCNSGQDDSVELHTTVISTAECLFNGDDRANVVASKRTKVENHHQLVSLHNEIYPAIVSLTDVSTECVIIFLGTKKFLLSKATSYRLIKKTIDKCTHCESNKAASVIAKCFFGDEISDNGFRMRMDSLKDDVSSNIHFLLQNKCALTVLCGHPQHNEEKESQTVIFKNIASED